MIGCESLISGQFVFPSLSSFRMEVSVQRYKEFLDHFLSVSCNFEERVRCWSLMVMSLKFSILNGEDLAPAANFLRYQLPRTRGYSVFVARLRYAIPSLPPEIEKVLDLLKPEHILSGHHTRFMPNQRQLAVA